MTVAEDRRHKRSQDPLVALHYQLAHARCESSLDALVVADGSGLVVAGAGAWAMCEELAAYAPLLADGPWNEPRLGGNSRMEELCREIDVRPVDIDGQRVLLCARGPETRDAMGAKVRAAAMERAAKGITRILRAAA